MGNRRNIAAIFRVIAGAYLIYLGVRLIRDGVLTGEMTGGHKVLGIVFSIAFIVAGVFFAIHAFRWMSKNREEEEEEETEEIVKEAEPVQEETAAGMSLFERASRSTIREGEEDAEEEDPYESSEE